MLYECTTTKKHIFNVSAIFFPFIFNSFEEKQTKIKKKKISFHILFHVEDFSFLFFRRNICTTWLIRWRRIFEAQLVHYTFIIFSRNNFGFISFKLFCFLLTCSLDIFSIWFLRLLWHPLNPYTNMTWNVIELITSIA